MDDRLIIKFDDHTEEGIQIILGTVYHKLGYKVDYLHLSDRANEDGADLIVSNNKEKIAIAVKKKPDKKDTSQLLELNDRNEDKKIYVYTFTPTKKFLDFMKKCNKVEYWDLRGLNKFIFDNNLYFFSNLLFREHNTMRHLEILKYLFFRIWNKCRKMEKKKVGEMNKKSVTQLWRLKDFSVIVNKIPEHTRFFFDDPLQINDEKLNLHFLNLFLDFMNSLEQPTLSYLGWFLDFYKNNENLINNSIIEMGDRSHWFQLSYFDSNIDFDDLLKSIKESIGDEKKELELLKKKAKYKEDKEEIKRMEEMSKSNSVWSAMGFWIKQLHNAGYFLEEVADDILSEYLRDYTIRYNETLEFRT